MDGRIIIDKGTRIFIASSEEDIKVLFSPQRQKIFKLLLSEGKPMHGKEVGDRLGLKAASAHFHLKKMEKTGVVHQSHTELINGITARYYEPTVDSIVMGDNFLEPTNDTEVQQRKYVVQNLFNSNRDAFLQSLQEKMVLWC